LQLRPPLSIGRAVSRIFAGLASLAMLMMVVTLSIGLYVGDLHRPNIDPRIQDWAMVHRMAGLATALVVVLVNSIVMTYFVGTGRWCKEVVETYNLNRELIRRSTAIKRRAFPWTILAMLAIVGVSALGAAGDPVTRRPATENWVTPHLIGAMAGIAFIGWAFIQEGIWIAAHHAVISQILEEVRRIRTDRGLEV